MRTSFVRTDGERAERLDAVAVTPGADRVLGIPIMLGRGFVDEDGLPGAPTVVVLGHEYWKQLGADRAVIGRVLRLDAGPAEVVGVLAPSPKFPPLGMAPHVWIPLRRDFTAADRPIPFSQGVWARLRPGVSAELAQERMDAVAPALAQARPERIRWEIELMPPDSWRANPDVRRALAILGATGALIFVIALVNGANLLLIRASVRARELALRIVLGASRVRLLRLLLAEGIAFGLTSAAAAAAVAWGTVRLLRGIVPDDLVHGSPFAFTVEGRTLSAIVGAAVLAGLVLGLVPALQLRGVRKQFPGRTAGSRDDTRTVRWARGGLVVGQVALSTALLVGGGLLVHSMIRLLAVNPGFDVDRIAVADVDLSATRYPDGSARADFARRLEEALEMRPEIDGVALTSGGGFNFDVALQVEGDEARQDQPTFVPHASVGPDYANTVGARLVSGRAFAGSDAGTENVLIDLDLAHFLWGDADPVGRRFRMDAQAPWLAVVGVVEELRLMGRDQRIGPGQLLYPASEGSKSEFLSFAIRTSGRPEAVLPVFEAVLHALDPEQPYLRLRTAAEMLAADEEKPRFLVTLMVALAALALVLATVGLYGVLAYSVERRRREFGVRIALGAQRERVLGQVLGAGWLLAGSGAVLGLLGARAAGGFLQPLLFEVDARDGVTAGAMVAIMLLTATLASLLPALRATAADPVEALRAD
jgi:putative ABC transport system permease protein